MSNLRNLIEGKVKVQTSPSAPGSSKKSLTSPDPDGESSWTSQSTPCYIHLVFPQPVRSASHLSITFQGGFVGTSAMIYIATKPKEGSSDIELGLMMGKRIYFDDTSKKQIIEIPYPSNSLIPATSNLPISPNPLPSTSTSATKSEIALNIQTERPPNPNSSSPAPILSSAKTDLPGIINDQRGTDTPKSDKSVYSNKSSGSSNESTLVKERLNQGWTVPDLTELKVEFERSSDNQGRVTVYSIELLG